jgi:hypothetical protein
MSGRWRRGISSLKFDMRGFFVVVYRDVKDWQIVELPQYWRFCQALENGTEKDYWDARHSMEDGSDEWYCAWTNIRSQMLEALCAPDEDVDLFDRAAPLLVVGCGKSGPCICVYVCVFCVPVPVCLCVCMYQECMRMCAYTGVFVCEL